MTGSPAAPRSFSALSWPVRLLAPLLMGALLSAGQAPVSSVLAALVALYAMFFLVRQAGGVAQAGWLMWLFGLGYFTFALVWILEPFQVEADVFGWMAPFALVLLSAGLALFWAAAGALALRLRRPWVIVVTLALAELARAYVFTGFPWAGIAQVWIGTPPAQTLAWIGPQGLTLLTLALVGGVVFPPVLWRFGTLIAGGTLVAGMAAWEARLPPAAETDALVRIVQPNAPQTEKWDPEKAATFFWRQIDATRATTESGARPDLIVWPETAIPQLLNNAEEALAVVAEAAGGVPVAVGIQRAEAFRYYNSLVVLGADGAVEDIYDKHHLVPFGEYMPFAALFRRSGIRGLAERAEGGYARGPGPEILDLGPLGTALPLICYEAIFPRHARGASGARPDMLLQVTNDAWFGTFAGPQQHLAQAQMRAIEQGLPLVRAANTGISAMISPRGRITASLRLGVHGHIDAALPEPLPPTLYSRTGDLPVAALLLLALTALIWPRLTINRD